MIVQVEPSQVIEDVRMVAHFAAHKFQLAAGFIGLLQFEKRYRQRESCSQTQRRIGGQSGLEFCDGYFVSVQLQSVIAPAQVRFWSLWPYGSWFLRLGFGAPPGEQC